MVDLIRVNHIINGEPVDAPPVENEFDVFLENINERIHTDGTIGMVGDLTISKNNPAIVLEGTEGSGDNWRIREHVEGTDSYLALEVYDGVSAWVTVLDLPDDPTALQTLIDDVKATQLQIEDDNPAIRFTGTEEDGNDAKIEEDAGDLVFYISTDNGSSWDEVFRITSDAALEVDTLRVTGGDPGWVGWYHLNMLAVVTDQLISGTGDISFEDQLVWPSPSSAGLTLPEGAMPVFFCEVTDVTRVTGTGIPTVVAVAGMDMNDEVRVRYAVTHGLGVVGQWNFRLSVYAIWDGVTEL
jgi:hypothetical protein